MGSSIGISVRFLAVTAALALAACGSNGIKPGGGDGDGGNGNGDGGYGYGDGGYQYPGPEAGAGDGPIQACAAETTTAQKLPLDIYVMLDKSQSMNESVGGGTTKWAAVTSALAQFVQQPTGLNGVSIGLQYFSIQSGGSTSCNAADYANPSVEIAPLPGVISALQASVLAHSPGGNTPTSAALQGAIDHCKAWGTSHPDHVVITILATDGEPTACNPQDIPGISAIATAGVNGTPKVLTFVIGVGSSLSNLNAIAAAGGTTQATIVDTTGNVGQQFLDALNAIRGAALGCVYKLPSPDGGIPDFDKVNVQYTPGGGGAAQMFPRVDGQANCPASGDAWYYDNASAPTLINLCPSTCQKVEADSTGSVEVLLGCKTYIG